MPLHHCPHRPSARWVGAVLRGLALALPAAPCTAAWVESATDALALGVAPDAPAARMELAPALPLDVPETARAQQLPQASPGRAATAPGWAVTGWVALPAQGTAVGLGLDVNAPAVHGPQRGTDLSLRWRTVLPGGEWLHVSAWHALVPASAAAGLASSAPTMGTRLELHLKPAPVFGFMAEARAIGLQLDGGAKITLKRRNGGLMVQYRMQFH